MRSTYTLALGLVLTAPLAAQAVPAVAPAPGSAVDNAANSISAADVARRIGVVADDSMMGRDTPSKGLDMTAQYVADEFKRFGLKPGGENGTYFQRYPIQRTRLDLAASRVVIKAGGREVVAPFTSAARYTQGTVGRKPATGTAFFVAGPVTPDDVAKMPLTGKVVFYLRDQTKAPPENSGQVLRALRLSGAAAVVSVSNLDSAGFALRVPKQAPERTVIDLGNPTPPVVEVHERGLPALLSGAGVDLAQVRGSSALVARDVPAVQVAVELRDTVISSLTAPNTIGILEGTDPKLKGEYVVFSAHMDHIGISRGQADSINNGADDDASGTTGVMELAEAYSRKGARPKRSLIFLTVSGEEKGLWGSRYYSEKPTVPLKDIVADINIDMIGRNWADTIVAIGKEHSDLGATLNRVNAAHPELRMTAIDDTWPEERFYFRSDHYNFARKGVPILFFFNGVHKDYHQPSDSPEKIDADKTARIVKLIFYLGQDVANSPARPQWKPESRKEIVEGSGR
jgi:Peptidase family M28